MIRKIYPNKSYGSLKVVSSKSVAHRLLICAALSDGVSEFYDIDLNDDIKHTIISLEALGAIIEISESMIKVVGIDLNMFHEKVVINAFESGSTLRFLVPIATYLSKEATFIGTKTLINRPMSVYEDLYKAQGHKYELSDKLTISGRLSPKHYVIPGNISSQFISGLLFMLPLLKSDSVIEIAGNFESKPYVDLTLKVLSDFKIEIMEENNKYLIKGNQKYQAQKLVCESDFSQAAFFAVLGAINNEVTINDLDFSSRQGDKYIFEILSKLGAEIKYTNNNVSIKAVKLGDGIFDIGQTPDLGPILFVLGLFSENKIVLKNTERLSIKESDRTAAMQSELIKFGAKIEVFENEVIIHRLDEFKVVDEVDAHNDHRIVMALSILASVLNYPLKINGAEAINKSYPTFFEDLEKVNIFNQ